MRVNPEVVFGLGSGGPSDPSRCQYGAALSQGAYSHVRDFVVGLGRGGWVDEWVEVTLDG